MRKAIGQSIKTLVMSVLSVYSLNSLGEVGDIIIMRHGQGFHNVHSIFNSNPLHKRYLPANLTRVGIDQVTEKANELAQRIDVKEVTKFYISPLPRTLQTYEQLKRTISFPNATDQIEANIIEIMAGHLEGRNYKDFIGRHGHLSRELMDQYGVETDEQVISRLKVFLKKVFLEQKRAQVKESVFVISHGTPCGHLANLLVPTGRIGMSTADFVVIPQSQVLELKRKWISSGILNMNEDPSTFSSPVKGVKEVENNLTDIVNDSLSNKPGVDSWTNSDSDS